MYALLMTAELGKHYSGRRVLVAGGAGAIGANLCFALAELGARVTILDDLSAAPRWNVPEHPAIEFLEGDILDDAALEEAFSSRPETVFHLAAFFANERSIAEPERNVLVNSLGTVRVLDRAARAKTHRYVFASSRSVYGRSLTPFRETDVSVDLETPYQISKLAAELYGNFYGAHHGIEVVNARIFNAYGAGELPGRYRNVVPNFIYMAMKSQPLPITGTGNETRDFTFVGDTVDGLLRCGGSAEAAGMAINIGGGSEVRIREVAELVNRLTGNTAGLKFETRRKWDAAQRTCADLTLARSVLGYEPHTPFAQGLERTVEWFRANWQRIEAHVGFAAAREAALDQASRLP
jgi:UDP-glucose 4-epimerase